MASINKPRFSGEQKEFSTRYEYFAYYMEHYEHVVSAKPIYIQQFETAISRNLIKAASRPNNLIDLEEKLKRVDTSKELNAIGLIAQRDAVLYTIEALNYSRDKILERIDLEA